MSDQNQYYPTYVGPDGLVHQSTTPANMPSAASVDQQQQQIAAQEAARQNAAMKARQQTPKVNVTRANGAIGIPMKRGK